MFQDIVLHYVSHYAYLIIFITMVLGLIGLPLPDEFIMMFAGYLVSKGKLIFVLTVITAFFGSTIGMTLSYLLGHKLGLPFIEKYGHKFYFSCDKLVKVEQWFRKFGKFAITIGYFFPGLRHVTAYSAGISKWSFRSFAMYAYPGGLIWVLTFILLGLILQDQWEPIYHKTHEYIWYIFVTAIIIVVVWGIIYRKTGDRIKRNKGEK